MAGNRNAQLDGLRGYAALAVIFFHSILEPDRTLPDRVWQAPWSKLSGSYDVAAKALLTVFNGQVAVVIFFTLSGAVLFDSLQRESQTPGPISLRFLIKRFFRIYPALAVCLLLCAVAFLLAGRPVTLPMLLNNLALYEFGINGATWTLNVEAFGAIFMVIAYFGYRHLREPGIMLAGGLFACIYLHPFDGTFFYFRMFIYSFALGMLIPTALGQRVIGYLPTPALPVLLIAALFSRHSIQETIVALAVGMIYYRKSGAIGRFLQRPFSAFLGLISYSLYLYNVLFLEIIMLYLNRWPLAVAHPIEAGLLSGVVITLLTIPLAYLSFRMVERPAIRFGETVAGRLGPPLPAEPAAAGPQH